MFDGFQGLELPDGRLELALTGAEEELRAQRRPVVHFGFGWVELTRERINCWTVTYNVYAWTNFVRRYTVCKQHCNS